MNHWLNDLVSQHQDLESPKTFWWWAGLTAISAVVKDNVWMDRQIFNLYPNIYTMLHADSGMKKGPPVSMAKQLVREVNNTRIIGGRSSIQGILKEMGTGYTDKITGKVNNKSAAFICSSELSSSIVEDKVATKILTDLYDRQYNIGEWKSLLKMESFELKDPIVSMLTATNEAMSEDFFTKSAIQGGYFARTFIIYEHQSQTDNSLIFPLLCRPDYKQAALYLKELAKLNGPFSPLASLEESEHFRFKKIKHTRTIYFNKVGLIYDDWYDKFKVFIRQAENKDSTGTLNRFGDSVLKVAMLLSLAENPILEISVNAMEEAIDYCEKLLGNVRKTTMGKHGLSDSGTIKTLIIMELLNAENNEISRKFLMKKMWDAYTTTEEFDTLMNSFCQAGIISYEARGTDVVYIMPEKQVTEYKRYLSGKFK